MKIILITLALTIALLFSSEGYSQGKSVTKDFDGDGYLSYEHGGTDCNDLNYKINPGAEPSASGTDNNCNGIVDYQEVVFKYGDLNGSQKIDIVDLCIILMEFGSQEESQADVNRDKKVDSADLDNMLDTYNTLTYGF